MKTKINKNFHQLLTVLDCDGIVINFWKAFCLAAGHKYILNCASWDYYTQTPWFKQTWTAIKDDKDFWSTLPILNLPEDINFNVHSFMTSIPPKMESARKHNLYNVHKFPRIPIIVTYNKLKKLTEMNADLLIDNKHETVQEINEAYERGETKCRALKYCPYYLDEEPTIWDLHDLTKVGEKLKELKWI